MIQIENVLERIKNEFYPSTKDNPTIISFDELFNITIKPKSILLFEPFDYHHECSPGFTKYFIDLGYNVDLLFSSVGIDSFSLFKRFEYIRFIIFNNWTQIQNNCENLREFIIHRKH